MSEEATCGCKKPDVRSGDFGVLCLGCGRNLKADMAVGSSSKSDVLEDKGQVDKEWLADIQPDEPVPKLSEGEQLECPESGFSHKSLQSPMHIRLIRLLPAMQHHEAIDCRIIQVKLSECNSGYEALSYTWGDQTQNEFIKCGPSGWLLGVTSNCAYALRDLRLPSKERILWIDAICINQTDISERNHQVALMADIYANAERVLIHLGQTHLTRDFFRVFKQHHAVPNTHGSLANIVDKFLSLPWFSRVWVLQEVVMAKRAAIVVSAKQFLDWNELSTARLYLMGLKTHTPPIFTLTQRDKKPLKDLASMLHMARACKSTDRRDRIYALLGLLEPADQLNLVADYGKSAPLLYAQFAIAVIKAYNHLDILSETYGMSSVIIIGKKPVKSSTMLPSWVPDLRRPQTHTSLAPWRTESKVAFTESPVATLPDLTLGDSSAPLIVTTSPWPNAAAQLPLLVKILRLDDPVRRKSGETEDFLVMSRVQEKVLKFASGRRIFRTHESFAIYPQDTKKDDIVCAIFGASVPFVVRTLPFGAYRFIGECYIPEYGSLLSSEDYSVLYIQSLKKQPSQQAGPSDVSGSGTVHTEDNIPWEEVSLV